MKRTFKYALGIALGLAASSAVFAQDYYVGPMPFPDTPDGRWFSRAVKELGDVGILVGYPDGRFRGNRYTSRYELAAAIYQAYIRVMAVTRGLDDRLKAVEDALAAGEGLTKEELDQIRATLKQLVDDMNMVKAWGPRIQTLEEAVARLEKELAALGADVAQMKRDIASLDARVTDLERRRLVFNINGDINILAMGGYGESSRYGLTVDARPTGVQRRVTAGVTGPGDPLGGSLGNMFEDLTVLHESAITITSNDLWEGPRFRGTFVFGNMTDFTARPAGGGPFGNQSTVLPNTPFDNGLASWYMQELGISYDFNLGGLTLSADIGRVGYKISPYIYQRPDNTPYFHNPRWDNGKWAMDGGIISFDFGSAAIDLFAGRVDAQNTTGGNTLNPMFAGATESSYAPFVLGGFGAFSAAGVPGTGSRPAGQFKFGELLIDRVAGANLNIPIGEMGGINLAYVYLASNGFAPASTIPGLVYNGIETIGGNIDLKFNNFAFRGSVAQTNLLDGSDRRNTRNNIAWDANLGYEASNWGANVGYKYIEPRFNAAGDWGRIGIWWNPTDIQGVYGGLYINPTQNLTLGGNFGFYRGLGKTMTPLTPGVLPYQGTLSGDQINTFSVGLGYNFNPNFSMDLGYEWVEYRFDTARFFGFAIGKPREQWFNVGFSYNMNDNAMLRFMWQFSDYTGDGVAEWTLFGPNGFNTIGRGGLISTQLSVRF